MKITTKTLIICFFILIIFKFSLIPFEEYSQQVNFEIEKLNDLALKNKPFLEIDRKASKVAKEFGTKNKKQMILMSPIFMLKRIQLWKFLLKIKK